MDSPTKKTITVYFDGLCRLCSREIRHYQKLEGADRVRFVDIAQADFKAEKEGVDPVDIHRTMHVRDRNGKLQLGVDAFICIWSELPSLRFLVPLAKLAPIHFILRCGYFVFSKIRPLLPRKNCETSPYCEVKRSSRS